MPLTSYITNPRTSKDTYKLTRRAAVITDGDDIIERTLSFVSDVGEDIDDTVGGCSSGENNYPSLRAGVHWKGGIKFREHLC